MGCLRWKRVAGLREVEWITGRPTKISATGMTIDCATGPAMVAEAISGGGEQTYSAGRHFGAEFVGESGGIL